MLKIFVFSIGFCVSISIIAADKKAKEVTKPKAVPSTEAVAKKAIIYTGEKLKIKNTIVKLFDASKKVNDSKLKKSSRRKIEKSIDWNRITRVCIGNANWKKYTKGRVRFKQLLKEIVSLTAYSRMVDFWTGATYQFTKIDVKGKEAVVTADFTITDSDDDEEEYSLIYYMSKKGRQWFIYDLAYEDLRYGENINEQITAFLKEKSFSALTKKMVKRRNKLREEEKTKKKG